MGFTISIVSFNTATNRQLRLVVFLLPQGIKRSIFLLKITSPSIKNKSVL